MCVCLCVSEREGDDYVGLCSPVPMYVVFEVQYHLVMSGHCREKNIKRDISIEVMCVAAVGVCVHLCVAGMGARM